MAQLEERKAKLEHYWAEYNDVQSRIIRWVRKLRSRCFEEAFYALSGRICELISPSSTLQTSIFSPSSSSVRDSDSSTHIRLSKLNLPTFSGKYDEWFPFFDTFNSVIHSNLSLSNTQRFQYLWIYISISLTGDASAVISSLELSNANYDVTVNSQGAIWQQARVCSNSRQWHIRFADHDKGKCNRSQKTLWQRHETFAHPSGIEIPRCIRIIFSFSF